MGHRRGERCKLHAANQRLSRALSASGGNLRGRVHAGWRGGEEERRAGKRSSQRSDCSMERELCVEWCHSISSCVCVTVCVCFNRLLGLSLEELPLPVPIGTVCRFLLLHSPKYPDCSVGARWSSTRHTCCFILHSHSVVFFYGAAGF